MFLKSWKAQETLVCSSGQHRGRSTSSVLRGHSLSKSRLLTLGVFASGHVSGSREEPAETEPSAQQPTDFPLSIPGLGGMSSEGQEKPSRFTSS